MSTPALSNIANPSEGPATTRGDTSTSINDNQPQEEECPFQFRLATSEEEIQQCRALRHAIFVQEQKVPVEAEYDGKDEHAFHILCYQKSMSAGEQRQEQGASSTAAAAESIVATGRVLLVPVKEDDKDKYHDTPSASTQVDTTILHAVLGRIAVRSDHRGKGLGRRVVRELERIAHGQGAIGASLTPHHYLERFYASLGYHPSPVGEGGNRLIHVNEHCQLIAMEKKLVP